MVHEPLRLARTLHLDDAVPPSQKRSIKPSPVFSFEARASCAAFSPVAREQLVEESLRLAAFGSLIAAPAWRRTRRAAERISSPESGTERRPERQLLFRNGEEGAPGGAV